MKNYSSLAQVKSDISAGVVNCQQLVAYYLENIENKKHLNAFVEVYAEEARAHAIEVDAKIKAGTAGKLAGMVVGLKDVLCLKDHGLQACSKILENFKSQFTGTAVQRLLDEDAIVIGRQSCDEFAMGSSNEKSAFGPVLNDLDNSRVPGGSSGGSAVAVQADLCLASLGSDTGGSVRQPAAFCGIIGFKPTYSRISRFGLIAYASSFDSIGILAKSVSDTALLLEVIAGADDFDSTVSHKPVPAYSKAASFTKKAKIAYLKECVEANGLDAEVKKQTLGTLDKLKNDGHTVTAVDFPYLDFLVPTYYVLTTAEASSNLSRFDGVHFGYRSPNATDLESTYKKSRSEGFGKEVKRRIMLGTFVLSAGYYDAYYGKAQQVRQLIQQDFSEAFKSVDLIMGPTCPSPAFKFGAKGDDPVAMYLEDIYTIATNLAGLPGMSVPCGMVEGKPVGLQIIGNYFDESRILNAAHQFQQVTDWHTQAPEGL